MHLLCKQAGLLAPDYGFVGPGSRDRHRRYLEAVKCGYQKDYLALEAFFRESLERSTADPNERLAVQRLLQAG